MLSLEFDKEDEIFYIRNRGDYEIEDVVKVTKRLIEDYSELKVVRQMTDFRHGKLTFQWSSVLSEITQLRKGLDELSSTFQDFYAAQVFSENANVSLINFFMQLRKPPNYHVKVFKSIEEARLWLINVHK